MWRAVIGAVMIAAPAVADIDYVTDPAMCPLPAIDRAEMGSTLTAEGMSEIEYFCEFATPLDPIQDGADQFQTRMGYCMEPGPLVFPEVWVIASYPGENGSVSVYSGANNASDHAGQPVIFYRCDS